MEEDQNLTKREHKKLRKEEHQEEEHGKEVKKGLTQKVVAFGIIIAIALGLWFLVFRPGSSNNSSGQNSAVTLDKITGSDHIFGNKEAKITLIEYGDFQCPACGTYAPIVKELMDKYKDQVEFVFRHFPLITIHQNAQISAQAAEAASLQGKFWEMLDQLYKNQSEWSETRDPRSYFEKYAANVGLDVDKFKTDIDSQEVKDKVNADYRSALAARLNQTPTFVLNGEIIDNPRGLQPFEDLLNNKINEVSPSAQTSPEASSSANN